MVTVPMRAGLFCLLTSLNIPSELLALGNPGLKHSSSPISRPRPPSNSNKCSQHVIFDKGGLDISSPPTIISRRLALIRPALLWPTYCSLLSTSPAARALTPKESSSQYDKYAATYDRLDGGGASKLLGIDDARTELIRRARGNVLEIGVGTGELTLSLSLLHAIYPSETFEMQTTNSPLP
jgi:hypothetical protein